MRQLCFRGRKRKSKKRKGVSIDIMISGLMFVLGESIKGGILLKIWVSWG